MRKGILFVLIGFFGLVLSGCVARTYSLTRERVDQDVSGNRGYLMGQPPASTEAVERKTERTVRVFEIELGRPVKLNKKTASASTEAAPQLEAPVSESVTIVSESVEAPIGNTQQYTVQKGDTLQKISQKLYGTTKKWVKIYDMNRDVLKSPNSIRPGQVINVPASDAIKESKEIKENLK